LAISDQMALLLENADLNSTNRDLTEQLNHGQTYISHLRIMVAVFTIGIIGFLLDRLMLALQAAFTFSAQR
ncbi:MAG: hypothetical protein AAF337_05725, partial [Pseudomonadota bacterium]